MCKSIHRLMPTIVDADADAAADDDVDDDLVIFFIIITVFNQLLITTSFKFFLFFRFVVSPFVFSSRTRSTRTERC